MLPDVFGSRHPFFMNLGCCASRMPRKSAFSLVSHPKIPLPLSLERQHHLNQEGLQQKSGKRRRFLAVQNVGYGLAEQKLFLE